MLNYFGNRKPDEKRVRTALKPLVGCDVTSVTIHEDRITVILGVGQIPARECAALENEAVAYIQKMAPKYDVQVIVTAEKVPQTPKKQPSQMIELDVPYVVAVASGKGGVGKSTLAMNLAAALSQMGKRVGLLDADIYGPSLPLMAGVQDAKPDQVDGKIIPVEAHGMKIMSIGFMVDASAPLVWRGAMVQSALKQLLRDVDWSGVEVLIIDMPPGTGDAQLTLSQQLKMSGAVIVSTPQDVALIDARKGLEMFRKVAVPVLGIVENMSVFCCPGCGQESDIFGRGGAKEEAARLGTPFLGEVPIAMPIRMQADAGVPLVLAEPDLPEAKAYQDIATQVWAQLGVAQKPAPKIIIEDAA